MAIRAPDGAKNSTDSMKSSTAVSAPSARFFNYADVVPLMKMSRWHKKGFLFLFEAIFVGEGRGRSLRL